MRGRIEQILREIQRIRADGYEDPGVIACILEFRLETAQTASKVPNSTLAMAYNTQEIVEYFESGGRSLRDICVWTDLSPDSVYKHLRSIGRDYPEDVIPFRTKPRIDVGIERGLELEKIGDLEEVTKQRAKQYINSSGQYRDWMRNKQKAKERRELENNV